MQVARKQKDPAFEIGTPASDASWARRNQTGAHIPRFGKTVEQLSFDVKVRNLSETASVAFFVLPGFAMLAYAAATDSLRAANDVHGAQLYRWTNVGVRRCNAEASNGATINCDADVFSTERFDYVFVCASDEAVEFNDPATFCWLRNQARNGATIGGISGGAFILARAGLLEGYQATLHWVYWNAFREEFPGVDLRQCVFVEGANRLTCGGGTAPLDMFHRVFSERHGAGFADRIGEWFLHTDVRSGAHAQRRGCQARLGVNHVGLIRALTAMENALEEPISREKLANIAAVSVRQLDRLFLTQIGRPVNAYYLELRLERARQLVLQSSLSQLEIAFACGFRSPSSYSKAYLAKFGVSPSRDRARNREQRTLWPRAQGGEWRPAIAATG
jgi:transcriptional regulator GlxA family with amidase domain